MGPSGRPHILASHPKDYSLLPTNMIGPGNYFWKSVNYKWLGSQEDLSNQLRKCHLTSESFVTLLGEAIFLDLFQTSPDLARMTQCLVEDESEILLDGNYYVLKIFVASNFKFHLRVRLSCKSELQHPKSDQFGHYIHFFCHLKMRNGFANLCFASSVEDSFACVLRPINQSYNSRVKRSSHSLP